MSASSSSSASISGIRSAHNAMASLPKPDRSSPQSSLPGSIYFLRVLGFIPASLSAFSLAFCRNRASVGNAEVGGGGTSEEEDEEKKAKSERERNDHLG